MKRYLTSILFFFVLCTSISLSAQETRYTAMNYGVGFSYAETLNDINGIGPNLNIGVDLPTKFSKLRIVPGLQIGTYSLGSQGSSRDELLNTALFDLMLDFRIFRYKTFSMNIQGGGVMGYSWGLIGTGYNFNYEDSTAPLSTNSQFFNNFNAGLKLGGGFVFAPKKGRFLYTLYPLNVTICNNISVVSANLSLKMKLCNNEK